MDKCRKFVLLGRLAIFQFGPYNSHAFELGLTYGFSLEENLISTTYSYFQNGAETQQNLLNYRGKHLAFEVAYTLPLFHSQRTRTDAIIAKNRRRNKRLQKNKERVLVQQNTVNKPKTQSPRYKKPVDPTFLPLMPDLNACFRTQSTDDVRYIETPFQYTQSRVDFEVYHSGGGNDGDIVSICANGKIVLNNIRLTDKGNRFAFKDVS